MNKFTAKMDETTLHEIFKETTKAKIAGRVFKMKEFSEMDKDPDLFEAEVRRWKTAIEKSVAENEKDVCVVKKHLFMWGIEDGTVEHPNLPIDGVPKDKTEFNALLKTGRMGRKWRNDAPEHNDADAKFNEATSALSGGVYTTYAAYKTDQAKIAKAMESTRYLLAQALNNEMSVAFMKGDFTTYKAVMNWIDKKTNIEKKVEYMHEMFAKITEAVEMKTHTDSRCRNYRMAMDRLYIDKPLKFPDYEMGDMRAEILEAEDYTPALSFIFLWSIYRQIDSKVWLKIEEEFRKEIGHEKYNKIGWQENKVKLYQIIDKHTDKNKASKGLVQAVQQQNQSDSETDEDEIEIELDDGVVYKIRPKSRDSKPPNWKNNFAKKFDLQQKGQRWQRRSTNSGKTIRTTKEQNRENFEQNFRKNSNPNGYWECRMCIADGRNGRVRNDAKCPIHKIRPGKLKNIPLAKVNTVSNQNQNSEETSVEQPGQFNSLRARFYGNDLDTDHE